jgi:hypothetical protein
VAFLATRQTSALVRKDDVKTMMVMKRVCIAGRCTGKCWGNSLGHIVKRLFDGLMTVELQRRYIVERPRDGKEALKPPQLFQHCMQ